MTRGCRPQSRREDTHLLDVIRDISNEGFMVVEDVSGRPIGVVTPADVAAAYDTFATPFSLIGDLDRLLRSVIDESMDWQDVLAVLDPVGRAEARGASTSSPSATTSAPSRTKGSGSNWAGRSTDRSSGSSSRPSARSATT